MCPPDLFQAFAVLETCLAHLAGAHHNLETFSNRFYPLMVTVVPKTLHFPTIPHLAGEIAKRVGFRDLSTGAAGQRLAFSSDSDQILPFRSHRQRIHVVQAPRPGSLS